jgi:hypothetical protein
MSETKICKYCKSEIASDAKICPHCRKRQKGLPIIAKILLVIVGLFVVIMAIPTKSTNTNSENNSSYTVTQSSDTKTQDTDSESAFKESCVAYAYNDIMRNPDGYKNKPCVLVGTVDQIIEGWLGSNSIFVSDINGDKWGCVYTYKDNENRLLEGDYVRVYGTLNGTTKTETVLGKQISLPYVSIKYIENSTDINSTTSNTLDDNSNVDVFGSDITLSQQNAIKSARNYLEFMAFSRKSLLSQLSSEYGDKYSVEDAEFAVNYLEENNLVDWNQQAVKAAQTYMEYSGYSKDALYEQLTSDYGNQFTKEQAEYALSQVGY